MSVYGTAEYPYAKRAREYKFNGEATSEKLADKAKDVHASYLEWAKYLKDDAEEAL